MGNIVIEKINNSEFDYIIFSTTVESPFSQMDSILEQIKTSKTINIVFDQLLQTGDNKNRFIGFTVNDNIDLSSARLVNDNDILKRNISQYLYNNQYLMNNSILLKDQKKIILNGEIL